MSEPQPTSLSTPPTRRRQADRPHCAICGEAMRERIVFGMVRPSLANGLMAANPNLTPEDMICRKHLTEQRTRYVEQLLERERGEISELERQVVESLAREETVARDIEAVVAVPAGPLRVYSTHLSHVGPQQRLPQVAALMDAVNRAPATGGTWDTAAGETLMFQEPAPAVPTSAIVAGDFNFTPAHPEYSLVCGMPGKHGRLATAEHLSDAWAAAGNGEEGVNSFPHEGRIDHVFVTHDLAPRVKSARIGYGVEASDHWPVFVAFDL